MREECDVLCSALLEKNAARRVSPSRAAERGTIVLHLATADWSVVSVIAYGFVHIDITLVTRCGSDGQWVCLEERVSPRTHEVWSMPHCRVLCVVFL